MVEAKMCQPKCARTISSTSSESSQSSFPSRSSQYPFTSSSCLELFLSLLCCFVDAVGGDAAGGEPGWSWTAAWRPHRGGTLRGRPPQRLARALPRPGPHAPIPNVPSAGTGTRGRDSGRPRMGGMGCHFGGKDGVCCGGRRPEVYKCSDLL